jgi:hypothetical protein
MTHAADDQIADAPPQPTPTAGRWRDALVLVGMLLIAAIRYYTPPSAASGLYIVSDEVEPVVAAQRLVTLGELNISVAGKTYPQRYPPLFSLLLAPAYPVAPHNLGAGVIVVWLFAIGGVACAFVIGRAMTGTTAGGALASAAVMLDPLLAWQATHITTDVPAATMALAACAALLWAARAASPVAGADDHPSLLPYLLGGVAVALAAGLRFMSAPLLLPWLALIALVPGRRAVRLLVVITPPLLMFLGNAVYQHRVFGDWRRTGYQFWCPVPYDYFSLTFSPSYVTSSLLTLRVLPAAGALAAGAAGAALLAFARSRRTPDATTPPQTKMSARVVAMFILLGVVPISLTYLFYCFPFARFHDALIYFGCVFGGAGAAVALSRLLKHRGEFIGIVLAFVIALTSLAYPARDDAGRWNRVIAAAMARFTPDDAVLITGCDEVFLEPNVLRGTRRTVLPYNRVSGYARTPIAWRKIPDPQPPPLHFGDHRNPGILAGGAIDLHEQTAIERPDYVLSLLRAGRPVYVDLMTTEPDNPAWSPLLEQVRREQVPQAPFLARLVLR